MDSNLVLDPQIRNWVVLPLIFIVVCVGIGRRWLMQMLKPGPKVIGAEEARHRLF